MDNGKQTDDIDNQTIGADREEKFRKFEIMRSSEALIAFYRSKGNEGPININTELGHFHVMRIANSRQRDEAISLLTFRRRDFYKIKLLVGKCRCHYADKTIDIDHSALIFVHPLIPFQLEELGEKITEHFCLFTEDFFSHFGRIKEYPVFQPHGDAIFQLNEEEQTYFSDLFCRMEEELHADYALKFDLLRNLVYEMIHRAVRMQAIGPAKGKGSNASARIHALFQELLELQFPLNTPLDSIRLKKPSDFARQLAIHVNHLNRAVKQISHKRTTACILERIVQEAKILLKHTNWTVAEIAYGLGFETPSRFIFTFRKNVGLSPLEFRKEVAS
ncbi:helix-turn-helix domain-containing protein [Olivibacter sitiensis]|uniref:helix-turn-helix domain-containing protein n=1 Tax=Olivibacter sitiensis TaxID=376470 RepID=UPI0003FE1E2C|nr:helix-turn-helix transcriptional regulator [Olivibacter sitiensis]